MNVEDILSEIDAEIERLQQVKSLLGNSSAAQPAKRRPGRPPASATSQAGATSSRRMMSAEGRARIAAAQKARWAKSKKAVSAPTKKKAGRPAKKGSAAKKNAAESSASQA